MNLHIQSKKGSAYFHTQKRLRERYGLEMTQNVEIVIAFDPETNSIITVYARSALNRLLHLAKIKGEIHIYSPLSFRL